MSTASPEAAAREVRSAVRAATADLPPGSLVLVACSGGPDSLALLQATSALRGRRALRVGVVSVDHGLQPGSADRARAVAARAGRAGLDPVEVVHVQVAQGGAGPEGEARRSRYAALDAVAGRWAAAAVLLGHTRDDQAETVLLGLARGSGARSLAGMAARSGRYRRPLLQLPRALLASSLPDDVQPWADPHNADPAYRRSRVRTALMPVLEATVGPGAADALARTADQLRADADALDRWTDAVQDDLRVEALLALPGAVRTRVLRRAALAAGCPPGELGAVHVAAVERLVTHWAGQRHVDLPGHRVARRVEGAVTFAAAPGRGPTA